MLPAVSPARYRQITGVALTLLVGIIVTGGAVRLTGSGLGCSDWPGCEQGRFVPALDLHPLVEFVNRAITGLVSLTIAVAVLGSVRRTPHRRDLTMLSLGLVAGVIGQIALGAVTVAFDLAPPFVMGHFLLSLVLVSNAAVLHHRAGEDLPPSAAGGAGRATVLEDRRRSGVARRLAVALLPALGVAVLAGTVVTGTGPHGGDEVAPRFGFDIETVSRIHSLAVLCFLGLLLALLQQLARGHAPAITQRRARELLAVACAQAAVGWVQYFTDVPAVLVGVHIFGATLTWLAAVRLVLVTTGRLEPCPSPPVPSRSAVPSVTPS